MNRFLITQSLLSSWNYMFTCYEDGQAEAYADFIRTLNREPSEPTEAMWNGIEFENEVYKVVMGVHRQHHLKWEQGIQTVAEIIKDATVQVRVQRDIAVCGINFLLYGVLDALSAGVIYDVKYLNKSFNSADLAGKYYNSAQHPAYLFMVPEAQRFEYLVSDGTDLYKEVYDRSITRPISEIITEFVQSLEAMNLIDLYKEKWLAK